MPHNTYYIFFFFFSSRRRHTRSLRDWSSDVCSSDLERDADGIFGLLNRREADEVAVIAQLPLTGLTQSVGSPRGAIGRADAANLGAARFARHLDEIGRASCRERVESAGVSVLKAEKI